MFSDDRSYVARERKFGHVWLTGVNMIAVSCSYLSLMILNGLYTTEAWSCQCGTPNILTGKYAQTYLRVRLSVFKCNQFNQCHRACCFHFTQMGAILRINENANAKIFYLTK